MNYLRRQQGKKKAKKLLRIYRLRDKDYKWQSCDEEQEERLLLRTRKRCSCSGCGNKRRYEGLTRKELIELLSEEEQVEELIEMDNDDW